MNRNDQFLIQLVAALPDDIWQQAMSVKQSGGQGMGAAGGELAGLGLDDPANGPKSWNDLQIETLGSERPPLADKDFLIPKQGLRQATAMPHDDAAGAYDAPGGF